MILFPGIETISHMRENGRMTIMFNAFIGPPRIVRLFGKGASSSILKINALEFNIDQSTEGTIHEYGTPEYEALIPMSKRKPGSRAAIVLDIHKVGSVRSDWRSLFLSLLTCNIQSCGYTVPYYDFKGDRTVLLEHMDKLENNDQAFEATGASDDSAMKDAGTSEAERAEKGLRAYWLKKNVKSIDGLPGITSAPYAKPTPQSTWKLGGESEIGKYDDESAGIVPVFHGKASVGNQDAKLVAAFSFGVLITMLSIKLSTRVSSLIL